MVGDIKRVFAFVFVLMICLGCTTGTSSMARQNCSLFGPAISKIDFDLANHLTTENNISAMFNLHNTVLKRMDYVDKTFAYQWSDENANYTVDILADNELKLYALFKENNKVTIDDVIHCFGQPSHYRSGIESGESPIFELEMLYLNQGIMFAVEQYSGHFPERISGDLLVNGYYRVKSGSLEEVVDRIYLRLSTLPSANILKDRIIKEMRPWPGKLSDLANNTRFLSP